MVRSTKLQVAAKGRWRIPGELDVESAFFVYIPLSGGFGHMLVPEVSMMIENNMIRIPFLEKDTFPIGSLYAVFIDKPEPPKRIGRPKKED